MVAEFIEKSLGYLFRNFKHRDDGLVINLPDFKDVPDNITLTSDDFAEGESMPLATAGHGVGDNRSPQLSWELKEDLPGIGSFVLILQDPDAPLPFPITHTLVYDIKPSLQELKAGEWNATGSTKKDATKQNFKIAYGFLPRLGYQGPRPIINHGPHKYVFAIFAVNQKATKAITELPGEILKWSAVINELKGNVLGRGILNGYYER